MNIFLVLKRILQKNRGMSVLVFCIMLLLSGSVIALEVTEYYEQERTRMSSFAEGALDSILSADNRIVYRARTLEMMLIRQKGGMTDFPAMAARIVGGDTSITSVQLAPGGIPGPVYPNGSMDAELVPGKSIQTDPSWSEKAAWVRKARLPLIFRQEGKPSSMRMLYPVWLDQSQDSSFWGYIIVDMNLEGLTRREELKNLFAMDVSYELYKEYYWNGGSGTLVYHSDTPLLENPVEKRIEGIDSVLCLRVSPTRSWYNYAAIGLICLLGLLFSLLATIVAMAYFSMHREKHAFETLSFTDALTGAFNRRKFEEILQAECRQEKPFLLCYIDFDRFKEINDVYGHDMGDLLLQAAARRLKDCLDKEDLFFRLGGDEFVAFIREPGSENLREARVRRMHEVMHQPFRFHAAELSMDISTGYVMYPQDASDSEELLRMADKRMYEEKQRHKHKRMTGYTE